MNIPKIDLKAYEYTLPEERIAKFPLEKRDSSKLLHYKNEQIEHFSFSDITKLLPSDCLLVYNNTKVIPARLIFQKETGAKIEIFLLQPISPTTVIPEIMLATFPVIWETMIGNAKKWKNGEILKGKVQLQNQVVIISAKLLDREKKHVEFSWDNSEIAFVDLIEACGEIPLPPYLNRKPTEEDKSRYQTIYSEKEGAVAAPTAGLHFTDEILEKLKEKGVQTEHVTLHVSAGTFQPIKSEKITEHPMHSEQIHIEIGTIKNLIEHTGEIVAVGTTSIRTLESLYWYGVMLLRNDGEEFLVPKLYPYGNFGELPEYKSSFKAIANKMEEKGITSLIGSTEIFIFPSYEFKVVKGLITNFHQPGSTLILLIASILGEKWKEVYLEALQNDYRFLSYGDSSLLWI
ncbi:S-adenosylmethionine:tRNA ribosyltransferase-isomerase [Algoriphagus sp. SE2]|uniref:S-adenosylmethionine:tRNA ribosyltransferase-isomerase n=1 Tax=Algoriphagus sp. SE2 TaxID=3141536 RepID=UPI0031CD9D9F